MIVVDIDGTLTEEDNEASHCMGKSNTKDEIMKIMDPVRIARMRPRLDIIKMVNDYYKQGHTIAIITGRWSLLEYVTLSWLHANQVKFQTLGMRKVEDWQMPAVDMKMFAFVDLMLQFPNEDKRTILWIDNDAEVIKAIETTGCKTLNVA